MIDTVFQWNDLTVSNSTIDHFTDLQFELEFEANFDSAKLQMSPTIL